MDKFDIFSRACKLYHKGYLAIDIDFHNDRFLSENPDCSKDDVKAIADKLFAFELMDKLCDEFGLHSYEVHYFCGLLGSRSQAMDILICEYGYDYVEADAIYRILCDYKDCYYS